MIRVVTAAPTRHLLAVEADEADVAAVTVSQRRLPLTEQECVCVIVELDDDSVIVETEVKLR